MTGPRSTGVSDRPEQRPSTLPFDPADLVAMRVLPAQFARMVGVSKQAVSKWIQHGTVTLGPDGKLDPAVASRQVIERTDPARLRARVFKQAVSGLEDLRQHVRALETQLTATEQATRFRCNDEIAEKLSTLCRRLVDGFGALVEADRAGTVDRAIERVVDQVFYPESITEPGADIVAQHGAADSRETTPAPPAPTQEN